MMNAKERRKKIVETLSQADAPLSASALASRFSVSRQIVVGDVALLRAEGVAVLATPRGYVIECVVAQPLHFEQSIICSHKDERMQEELYTIVDLGGAILDVTVEHSVYGELTAPLRIFSRYDADLFLQSICKANSRPLCDLTDGVHVHRIRCFNEDVFHRIKITLDEKGLLFSV